MTRILSVLTLATLLFSCVSDKSKTSNEVVRDPTPKPLTDSLPKVERATLPPDYPFQLTIHEGSNWDLKIDSVTEQDFDHKRREVYQEKKINGDSLLATFSNRFQNVITLTDSCCILKGIDRDVEICRKRPSDDRQWKGYDGIGYEHGFLILMEWGYESWSFISFNPVTRDYVYTSNEPRFIDSSIIYSVGNYYGEGQFQIKNLTENKYFGFETYNWQLTGFYRHGNSILMEFASRTKKKYLRATFSM